MEAINNVTGTLLSDDQMQAIAIINVITSSLSGLGALSILLCSAYHRRMCIPEVYPILHMSIADLLASMFFLISTIMFLRSTANFPGSEGPCDFLTAIMTSFYICTLFLTFSYALEAYLRIRKKLSSSPRDQQTVVSFSGMHMVYAICWILPLVAGVILLVFTHFVSEEDEKKEGSDQRQTRIIPQQCSTCLPIFHYSQDKPCWTYVENGPSWHLAYKLVFLLPLIVVFVVNIIIYVLIAKTFKQVWERKGLYGFHQHQDETMLRRKSILYQSAFLICWLPTLILGFISFIPAFHMKPYFALYLLQALFGPLQGFFNCIIYGWKRESFRRALSDSTRLTSTNMPSYSSLTL